MSESAFDDPVVVLKKTHWARGCQITIILVGYFDLHVVLLSPRFALASSQALC